MSLPIEKRRQWIKSRREQRKLTRYARLRRQFLRYCVLLSLLSASIFLFYRMPCHLSEGKEYGLIIEGNAVLSNEQICHVLKSELANIPLFFLNPSELENKLKKLSVVQHAFVRRYVLPRPTIKIEVLEEFPWATVYSSEQPQFVISESGKLISINDFPNVYQPALKIYVESASQLHLGQTEIEQWANWLAFLSKEMQCPVLSLDMREPHNVKVETSKLLLVLGNPDSGLTKRLGRLASVLEVLDNQHKEPTYVNLALNGNIPVKLAKKSDKNASDIKLSRL